MAEGLRPLARTGPAGAAFVAGAPAAGLVAVCLVATVALVPAVALLAASNLGLSVSRDFLGWLANILWFTLLQATLSTVLSLAGAVPLARAFARRPDLAGRRVLLAMLALPLAIPALVAVLGILEVWGRQGWISSALQTSGLTGPLNIYGLPGILLAHVFFNLPLSARILVSHLDRISPENWRIASQLGFSARDVFRHVEWPVIRHVLPGIALLVFMLCISSFAIVLMLGGGPGATTVEVAIYQSLRYDFDPPRAVFLSAIQILLCAAVFAAGGRLTSELAAMSSLHRPSPRPDAAGSALRDAIVIGAGTAFVALPLLAIVLAGLKAPMVELLSEAAFWRALRTSAMLGFSAALLAVLVAWAMLSARRTLGRRRKPSLPARILDNAIDMSGSLILVVPPVVIGAGWFIALHRAGFADTAAPLIVCVVNALMALPFVIRLLGPAIQQQAQLHDRLCASLGLAGWRRWRLIDLPVMARVMALAFAFAFALSLGDLGVAALFASNQFTTLPLLLMQKMGSYRTADAAGLALILASMCLVLLALADRLKTRAGT